MNTRTQSLYTELDTVKRKLAESEALSICALHTAHSALPKCGHSRLTASAVLVKLTALGGRELAFFAVPDGLSPETIEALQADIARAIKLTLAYVPAALLKKAQS